MSDKKPRFKVGQVVCVMGIERLGDPDLFGVVDGFDDGRWHVLVNGSTMKLLEEIVRPLTKRERGGS